MLTHERLIEALDYDADSGVFTWKLSIGSTKRGRIAGGKTHHGYRALGLDGTLYYAHRLAWFYIYKETPHEVDHIDRDRSNNRIANLRSVNRSLNNHNRTDVIGGTGYRGVWFSGDKFISVIRVNGKRRSLGRFNSAVDASEAYEMERIRCGLP